MKVPKELSKYEFQCYLNEISNGKKEKVMRYVRQEDAIRSLFGELLIRAVIKRERGIASNLLHFSYNEYGKPYLNGELDFHFNISHSGSWVVCVTDNKPIGIDIELIKPIDLEIAQRFFTTEEYRYITSQRDYNRLTCFYDFWTLKESFVKAIGKGLIVPLNSFSINITTNRKFILECNTTVGSFWLNQYEIDPEYKLSVCSMHENFPSEVIQILYSDLVAHTLVSKICESGKDE
ncbi:4'-phosphopantetheinyl transferase family protein [Bacillus pseudomycoides]|uniref:4'-phosphopantetheinyl transferase family protein n=1 Tax=Bacillus pseudomycoides TaxID=64104 RepID=UPI001483397D|nr:4'-phosphopantetheinyl transferase superfamily protein [Bacillus pseudomycoides]MED1478162.1 4'-phosphopantetheinyl transferase superfamily protein [Bacillus pseudomycoides]MED1536412.1 4'-phosphopantetheinyl transferase superfamily protein [Bacillus pseudomycoides]